MTPCLRTEADVFVQGSPMELESVQEYFMAKNMQAWGCQVALPYGETWETLADVLAERFSNHIWHISHWQEEGPRGA